MYNGNFTFDSNPQEAGFFLSILLSYPDYVTFESLNSAASIFKKYIDNWVNEEISEMDIKTAMDVVSYILEGY